MSIQKLINWSRSEFSNLPWRKSRSLYRTLVSEIMLQQTTVGTVKNHFDRFLDTFPTIEHLASASEEELIVAWKGLGYYRRARNLKKIAEAIVSRGSFSENVSELQTIPGIGPYTANAIIGIGMDRPALAVDANLERVIARLFGIGMEKGTKLQKEIQQLFLDRKIFYNLNSYRALNEALMDLGRSVCQARRASCEICPLRKDCRAFESGNPLSFPVDAKSDKPKDEHELHLLRCFVIKKGKLLVYRKNESEWLSGQFEVPTFILKTTDKKLKQYPHLSLEAEIKATYKTGITKYKILNNVTLMKESEFKKIQFSRPLEWRDLHLEDSNFSTAIMKGLKKIL